MKTWLVTGGSGFLGRHVLDILGMESPERRVFVLGRRHPGGWPCEDFFRADLDDLEGLCRIIAGIRPDVVIHAAGKTPPAPAAFLYRANTRATAHLLTALQRIGKPSRVVLAGSAAELGPVPVECLPVDEARPCRPIDAYGLSKWAATRLGLSESPPLEVVAARIFNPIGPGLPASQAFGRFAGLLAEAGTDPLILPVGNLEARRDFLDVRDVASALVALAKKGLAGSVYNVGTGRSRSIAEGLEILIRLSGRSVRVEPGFSPRGPSDSRADISKITAEIGWAPKIPWEKSLADLWEEVRRRSTPRRVA